MTSWVAIAYGALDMRGWHENQSDVEIMLLPIYPIDEPMGLSGAPAELWRRLVGGPVADASLSDEDRTLVREFAEFGIASSDAGHAARITQLDPPWLLSPLHELVYALVASVARDHGIDAVFIKGPVLHKQGLRERQHSGDVDVWVDPDRIEQMAEHLLPWNWIEQETLWTGVKAYHSITLDPRAWGAQIDLHRHMPGCALRDAELFEVLLRATETGRFGGCGVRVPAPAAHAVISALHEMRPSRSRPTLSAGTVAAVVEGLQRGGSASPAWAEEARAVAALRPVLVEAFDGYNFAEVDYAAPANWTRRAKATRSAELWAALKAVPLKQRARMLFRIVWPTDADIRLSDVEAGFSGEKLVSARVRRLGRAFRATVWRYRPDSLGS